MSKTMLAISVAMAVGVVVYLIMRRRSSAGNESYATPLTSGENATPAVANKGTEVAATFSDKVIPLDVSTVSGCGDSAKCPL